MAKSKNHTNHNQSYKAHRNGITAVKRTVYLNNKGQNQKLIRNTRYAKKFDPSIKKPKNFARKIAKIAKLGLKNVYTVKKVVPVAPAKADKKEVAKKDVVRKGDKK